MLLGRVYTWVICIADFMPAIIFEKSGCDGEVREGGSGVWLLGTEDAVKDLWRHLYMMC